MGKSVFHKREEETRPFLSHSFAKKCSAAQRIATNRGPPGRCAKPKDISSLRFQF